MTKRARPSLCCGLTLLIAALGAGTGCNSTGRSQSAGHDGSLDANANGGAGNGGVMGTGGGDGDATPGAGGGAGRDASAGTGATPAGGTGSGGTAAAGSGGASDVGRGGAGGAGGAGGSGAPDAGDAYVDRARDVPGSPDAPLDEARDAAADSPGPLDTGAALDSAGLTVVTYPGDPDTIFANPERGFYQVNEVRTSSYEALSQSWLQNIRTQGAVSLLFHMVYLDSFVNADLGQSFLDALAADFTTMRKAGVKAVVRFAYTDKDTAPYGDASKTRVLGHIAQLKPILFASSDVIAVLQAGFIGAWGEWYYTDTFGTGSISASQWTDRQDVVNALLDALDHGRPVQLRTPAFKQHFYGAAALTSAEAFTGTAKARVGHHNDCFLADATDMGTYTNVTADKGYLAQENLYVPQGGETCATSSYSGWSNAQTDMGNLHWSFLNSAYHPDVLASWGTSIDIAKRRLGYRLSLVAGAYTTEVPAGMQAFVQFVIRNDGFAPPFLPRELNVILRGSGGNYIAKVPDDPRWFVPGVPMTVTRTLCLPVSMPPGAYSLWLALADPVPALNARPEYSIRLANQGTWEATTGYNNLNHTLMVTAALPNPSVCSAGGITVVPL